MTPSVFSTPVSLPFAGLARQGYNATQKRLRAAGFASRSICQAMESLAFGRIVVFRSSLELGLASLYCIWLCVSTLCRKALNHNMLW
jgi:hypothetical protein